MEESAIFLCPSQMVDCVFHLDARIARREADSECHDGRCSASKYSTSGLLGIVVEKPLGGHTLARLALELGAVPVAQLLGVALVGVG